MKPTIVYQFKVEVWRKRIGTSRYFYYETFCYKTYNDMKDDLESLYVNNPNSEFKTYISRVAVAMY